MHRFGQVVLDSSLPQLDRIFDYTLKPDVDYRFGQQVSVRFGASQKPQTGFIVGFPATSEYAKTAIHSVDHETPLLRDDVYKLCRMIADRQAVAIGEILKQAIVQPTPTSQADTTQKIDVSEAINTLTSSVSARFGTEAGPKQVVQNSIRGVLISGAMFPEWAVYAILESLKSYAQAKSAIIAVPDFRDVATVERLGSLLGIAEVVRTYLGKSSKLARANDFLTVLGEQLIVVGTRLAVYAPVANLGVIVLHSDLDPSHENPQSPYLASREIAIMRSEITGSRLVFTNHSVSSELMRLVDIGYATIVQSQAKPVRISFGGPSVSVKQIITEGLAMGAVLLLNRNAGHAASVVCEGCKTRLNCEKCAGPMFMPAPLNFECRRCGWRKPADCLYCTNTKPEGRGGGVERSAAEYGRIFPGARIIESSGKKQINGTGARSLVIATPGAIPTISTGYQVIIIDNPQNWLNRDSMRAREHALREWSDALTQLALDGRGHLANFENDLARRFSLGDLMSLSKEEYQARKALQLPPTKRLATINGNQESISLITTEATKMGLEVISVNGKNPATAIIRYSYAKGREFALLVRKVQLATPPTDGERKRRGLQVHMDSQDLI